MDAAYAVKTHDGGTPCKCGPWLSHFVYAIRSRRLHSKEKDIQLRFI